MYPFEFWNPDRNRMEFHYDRFDVFRQQLFQGYPVTNQYPRREITLAFPSDRLEDVFVHWNPHATIGNHHLDGHHYFFDDSDWSTIFEVYPAHYHIGGGDAWRLFIEKGHQNPWGERIRIMSTASDIHDDASNRFAYFRGKYWKLMGGWKVCRRPMRPMRPIWPLRRVFTPDVDYYPDALMRRIYPNIFPELQDNLWAQEGF